MDMITIRAAAVVYFVALAAGYFFLMQHPEVQAGLDSQMAGRLTRAWLCGCLQ